MIPIDEIVFNELKTIADFSKLDLNEDLMRDNALRRPFERYLLLTHFADNLKIDQVQLFYNRYYWFIKLTEAYLKKFGNDDLNLRQEGFKILEEGQHYDNIDWSEIETITNLAKGEI
jgi:hypothetical protein